MFIESYKILQSELEAKGVTFKTFDEVNEWKEGTEQVLVGRIKAHGKGGNLPEASVCIFVDMDFVKRIREINKEFDPDIIITKIDSKPKIYPTDVSWNKGPIRGEIMGGCVCVKNEVFQKHIHAFGQPKAGDYFFIKEIFDSKNGYRIHWEDRVTIQAVRGHGRIE